MSQNTVDAASAPLACGGDPFAPAAHAARDAERWTRFTPDADAIRALTAEHGGDARCLVLAPWFAEAPAALQRVLVMGTQTSAVLALALVSVADADGLVSATLDELRTAMAAFGVAGNNRGTVSHLMQELAEQGFVRREPHPGDMRRSRYRLHVAACWAAPAGSVSICGGAA